MAWMLCLHCCCQGDRALEAKGGTSHVPPCLPQAVYQPSHLRDARDALLLPLEQNARSCGTNPQAMWRVPPGRLSTNLIIYMTRLALAAGCLLI